MCRDLSGQLVDRQSRRARGLFYLKSAADLGTLRFLHQRGPMFLIPAIAVAVAALALIGVIVWRMSLRVSGDLRNVTVSREWLQRQNGGGRE